VTRGVWRRPIGPIPTLAVEIALAVAVGLPLVVLVDAILRFLAGR